MGRKRKAALPWCYYCGREFSDERVLGSHQRSKHFKCGSCDRLCNSLPAMRHHALKAHGENVLKARHSRGGIRLAFLRPRPLSLARCLRLCRQVPNARPNRESVEVSVVGMVGIPDAAWEGAPAQGSSRHQTLRRQEVTLRAI